MVTAALRSRLFPYAVESMLAGCGAGRCERFTHPLILHAPCSDVSARPQWLLCAAVGMCAAREPWAAALRPVLEPLVRKRRHPRGRPLCAVPRALTWLAGD